MAGGVRPGARDAEPVAYTGPRPLIYLEYNNLTSGAQWNKSNSTVDPLPGGPGLTYVAATKGTTSACNRERILLRALWRLMATRLSIR